MRIIAVMSPKGGIGKTTTSDSIAYMLGEEQGKRVLVLDGDPQGDTSKTFGVFEPDGIGMSELLEKHECVGGTYKTGDLIRPTEYSHVDIIPANGYLMKTDMNLLLKSEDNQVTRLREALRLRFFSVSAQSREMRKRTHRKMRNREQQPTRW